MFTLMSMGRSGRAGQHDMTFVAGPKFVVESREHRRTVVPFIGKLISCTWSQAERTVDPWSGVCVARVCVAKDMGID